MDAHCERRNSIEESEMCKGRGVIGGEEDEVDEILREGSVRVCSDGDGERDGMDMDIPQPCDMGIISSSCCCSCCCCCNCNCIYCINVINCIHGDVYISVYVLIIVDLNNKNNSSICVR